MSRAGWGVMALATAAAFWPTWVWYVARLRDGADEKVGLLAIVAAILIALLRHAPTRLRPPLPVLAGLALAYAALTYAGAPALVRGSVALLAVALLLSAAAFGRRLHAGTAALLLLGLPLESSLQFYLGYPLRVLATWLAGGLLRLFGLQVTAVGTLLMWRGEAVGVDAPCSGIHMLWVGLLVAAAMCALKDWGPLRSTWASALALALVVLANGLRVAMLFVKEAGLADLPDWTHEGLGALVFGAAMLALVEVLGRARSLPALHVEHEGPTPSGEPSAESRATRRPALALYVACALLAALAARLPHGCRPPASATFPGWPEALDGAALVRVPPAASDERLARDFPGRFARFSDGRNGILLRWLDEPTRQLHSAADCFRGNGFSTHPRAGRIDARGQRWSCFQAARGLESATVCERIFDASGASWTDVSSWWWAAALGRATGPYWAVTVVEPRA